MKKSAKSSRKEEAALNMTIGQFEKLLNKELKKEFGAGAGPVQIGMPQSKTPLNKNIKFKTLMRGMKSSR